MQIFETVAALKKWLKTQKNVGFVPTMGALHDGHTSLINKALSENKVVVCSIFVNPTQFDNKEDLEKYPRTVDEDASILEKAGCQALFLPSVAEMYPNGEESKHYHFGGIEYEMEGEFRQGHFDGVATIVSRFFEIIEPDKAYFGEKDFQQLRIIQELVRQEFPTIEIVPVPIFRESDGLAMSSRNVRLTQRFRAISPIIYQTLQWVKENQTQLSITEIKSEVEKIFNDSDLKLEYFSLSDEQTLKPIKTWNESETFRAFVAAYAGKIRLIDNLKII